jgi:PadR family transcriptional regulator PadR
VTDAPNKKFRKEMNAGTASLVMLSVLGSATDPMYGYQIAKIVTQKGAMMKQGALYPVLRSLESIGLLDSFVEPSVAGPPRRYYRITEHGRNTLLEWLEIWEHTKNFVDAAVKGLEND